MAHNHEILKWKILRKSGRKIRKDIGEEINEIFLICCNGSLFSNTPLQTDGRNFLQFVFCVGSSSLNIFFFFFLCWPGFPNCTSKAKNKANYGPKEIKDRPGF
jgi:hypothetical protein